MQRNTPIAPAPECAVVQYASGITRGRTSGGPFLPIVGFYSQIGREPELDELAGAAGVATCEIRHSGGAIVKHWYFGERFAFFPITAGPPATTISACRSARFRQATAEAGIGLTWPQGERSRMAVRGIAVLDQAPIMVQLSVRSTMTGVLLDALVDHVRACMAADALVKAGGRRSSDVLPYELLMPLQAGEPTVVGSDQTAEIVPFVSAPRPRSRASISKVYGGRKRSHVRPIKSGRLCRPGRLGMTAAKRTAIAISRSKVLTAPCGAWQ